ncbi:hypothetical protein AGLY_015399 [Aphis glycines]|uniref:Uncharacterized protein n=1 Tax=Aphis glycines TaxID=307491 RepID=A0A6G0T137_APHGL|nr:hypothetical protein AGLY_015399 [Aphis glycines]
MINGMNEKMDRDNFISLKLMIKVVIIDMKYFIFMLYSKIKINYINLSIRNVNINILHINTYLKYNESYTLKYKDNYFLWTLNSMIRCSLFRAVSFRKSDLVSALVVMFLKVTSNNLLDSERSDECIDFTMIVDQIFLALSNYLLTNHLRSESGYQRTICFFSSNTYAQHKQHLRSPEPILLKEQKVHIPTLTIHILCTNVNHKENRPLGWSKQQRRNKVSKDQNFITNKNQLKYKKETQFIVSSNDKSHFFKLIKSLFSCCHRLLRWMNIRKLIIILHYDKRLAGLGFRRTRLYRRRNYRPVTTAAKTIREYTIYIDTTY